MKDSQQSARTEASGAVPSPGSASALHADRIFLLECRLEQLRSAVADARSEADVARSRLAEAAAREADRARREALLREELATAREEVASLHRRLEQSEALRAEVEGHLFEAGAREDVEELVRLRRELLATRERAAVDERTVAHLRARVEDLVATRETLLTRVVEWQRLVRRGDDEAVDLAEFIASLRGDILELEHQNALGERREANLREQLERAGAGAKLARTKPGPEPEPRDQPARGAEVPVQVAAGMADASEQPEALTAVPEAQEGERTIAPMDEGAIVGDFEEPAGRRAVAVDPPAARAEGGRTDEVIAALAAAKSPEAQVDLLLRLGRSGDEGAYHAIRRSAAAAEPRVRAASYEALGRLLEHDPSRLEPQLRAGLADADARVRRRVVLAAATARGLDLRPLLEPLGADPDAQVRRVIQQVLRRAALDRASGVGEVSAPAPTGPDLTRGATSSGAAS